MGPQIFQAIFFLQGRVSFSPVVFAQYVLKTLTLETTLETSQCIPTLSTGAEVPQESFPPSNLPLSLAALELSNFLSCPPLP